MCVKQHKIIVWLCSVNIVVVNVVLVPCIMFKFYFQDCEFKVTQVAETETKQKQNKTKTSSWSLLIASEPLPRVAGLQLPGGAAEPTEVSICRVRATTSAIPAPPELGGWNCLVLLWGRPCGS